MLNLSAVALALNWWLVGSYRTGEFIVYTGISAVKMLVNTVKSFNDVSVLLYEGSILWFRDIYESLCAVQEVLCNFGDQLLEIGSFLSKTATAAVITPFSLLAVVVASIRELLVLLGSSCLFLLSLPSLALFYLMDMLVHTLGILRSFASYATERLTKQAADIETLEVLVGLVVACGLIVVATCVKKLVVQWYFKFKTKAVKPLKTWAKSTWRKATTHVRRRRKSNSKMQETELCIVCLGNARSVCLLPCRHLCLCKTCTQTLPYPVRCPLCRQHTEDFLHVYL